MNVKSLLALLFFLALGCGTKSTNKSVVLDTCGNGTLESSEVCDPNINSGEGACPQFCENQTSCSVGTLIGSANECTAKCGIFVVEECNDGDGCCAAGCDETNDSDCSMTCGDGVVDEGETCDGNCESCDDGNACTTDISTGSAESCSLECAYEQVTSCVDGDGCCAPGCSESEDSDCSTSCGDGIVVAGEVCDGNCPTTCDDQDACTVDAKSGSEELCNVVCTNTQIDACTDNDGCCAAGCTSANDNDCVCQPKTCAELGATCGEVSDGCGGILSCGNCAAQEACDANVCVATPQGPTGAPCTADINCSDAGAFCANAGDFKDGYCTKQCNDDFDCATGSHCTQLPGYSSSICVENCQSDNECRADGYRCRDVDSDNLSECVPAPVGNSPPGGACAGIYECDGRSDLCLAGPGFPGGMCSSQCFFNGQCFSETCLIDSNGFGYCGFLCDNASDCRTGYQCTDVTDDITNEVVGVCM